MHAKEFLETKKWTDDDISDWQKEQALRDF
jgi:hypothetical protein